MGCVAQKYHDPTHKLLPCFCLMIACTCGAGGGGHICGILRYVMFILGVAR